MRWGINFYGQRIWWLPSFAIERSEVNPYCVLLLVEIGKAAASLKIGVVATYLVVSVEAGIRRFGDRVLLRRVAQKEA